MSSPPKAVILLFLLVPLMGAPPSFLRAQEIDGELPAWALYQKGLELLPSPDDALVSASQTDPGEALRYFRRAIARREEELLERGFELETAVSLFPEAEAGLARVYRSEGNVTLAERHYLRALDAAAFLAIPEMEIEIRYELAVLYRDSGSGLRAQEQWSIVVDEVDAMQSDETRELLDNYRRIFWDEGPDRLVQLYRHENLASLNAHQRLGEQLLSLGRYEAAFDHELLAVVKIVTVAVEEIRVYRPLYEFEQLEATLRLVRSYPRIAEFLVDSGFFGSLERLAQATFRLRGSNSRSRELWRLVADHGPSGSAPTLKARQRLVTPDSDPLVVPR